MEAFLEGDLERSAQVSAQLAGAFAVLRELGPGYEEALRVGLRCGRLFGPVDRDQAQAVALVDAIRESPSIASAAFRGCAVSVDPSERKAAARGLPELSVVNPSVAKELLAYLLSDADPEVETQASESAELMSRIARGAQKE